MGAGGVIADLGYVQYHSWGFGYHREVGIMFRRHGRNGGNEGTGGNGELVSDLGWLVCEVISTPAG